MNKKVNLLIIGTQKAGTTSLYEYIRQHKDIYFSDIKEVIYFVNDKLFDKGEEYYHSFFTKIENEKIIASAYVHMLPSKKAPKRVQAYNPNMKFIVMLREPISRAYSAYNYAIKNGWEDSNNSFEDTLTLEPKRVEDEEYDLMYFENGMYYKHLTYWEQFFPKENFLLIKDSELKEDAKKVVERVCSFLNIENLVDEIDTSKEFNKAGKVRFKFLQSFLLSKDSKIKTIFGYLFPRRLKVWIRANILKKVYKFNQVNQQNTPLDKNIREQLKKLFYEDSKNMKERYNIEF